MKWILLPTSLLLLFCESVLACAPIKDIEHLFNQSKFVVIVVPEEITQIQKHRYKDPRDMVEDVKFRVLFSFKGDKLIGQQVSSHSDLEFGCSVSVVNRPVWLEVPAPATVPLDISDKTVPLKLSGAWIIFSEMEPFILDAEQHLPLESVSALDWFKLFQLSIPASIPASVLARE